MQIRSDKFVDVTDHVRGDDGDTLSSVGSRWISVSSSHRACISLL